MDDTATEAGPLTTNDELAEYPGAPFTTLAVEVACAEVRGVCYWHIAPPVEGVRFTLDLESDTDVLILKSLHLTAVTDVIDERTGEHLTGWRVSKSGMVALPRRISAGVAVVTVVGTHGLAEAPKELKAVIADRARIFDTSNERDPELRTRTVGSVSYTWVNRRDGDADPMEPYAHVLHRFRAK